MASLKNFMDISDKFNADRILTWSLLPIIKTRQHNVNIYVKISTDAREKQGA